MKKYLTFTLIGGLLSAFSVPSFAVTYDKSQVAEDSLVKSGVKKFKIGVMGKIYKPTSTFSNRNIPWLIDIANKGQKRGYWRQGCHQLARAYDRSSFAYITYFNPHNCVTNGGQSNWWNVAEYPPHQIFTGDAEGSPLTLAGTNGGKIKHAVLGSDAVGETAVTRNSQVTALQNVFANFTSIADGNGVIGYRYRNDFPFSNIAGQILFLLPHSHDWTVYSGTMALCHLGADDKLEAVEFMKGQFVQNSKASVFAATQAQGQTALCEGFGKNMKNGYLGLLTQVIDQSATHSFPNLNNTDWRTKSGIAGIRTKYRNYGAYGLRFFDQNIAGPYGGAYTLVGQ